MGKSQPPQLLSELMYIWPENLKRSKMKTDIHNRPHHIFVWSLDTILVWSRELQEIDQSEIKSIIRNQAKLHLNKLARFF